MLRSETLQFKRGDELLFENLSFVVHPGQRVAVAGRNGVGKSTLFELILGQLHSDIGDLTFPASWSIGYMEQEAEVTDRPALEYVIDGHKELRRVERGIATEQNETKLAMLHSDFHDLGGYEAHATAGEILHGLGFSGEDFVKPYSDFSGGWRIRLNLAQALMRPCDLLLLDEPTNHLDLETIMWLEGWLRRFEGTVLIIAHDRAFLDASTNHTLYLSGKTGRLYSGNYSSCERQRAEQLEQEEAIATKQATQAAHIQKFVDRFRAKASKAKQVQSRIKALERLQFTVSVHVDSPYRVQFKDPEKVSNPLLSFRDLKLGYDDSVVLKGLSQTLLPGARIGVLGHNGAGKSTLLKAIVGDLEPLSGELHLGLHCAVGYFAQHQLESLDPSQTGLRAILEENPAWSEQQARDFLGGWGFTADMTVRPISTLSGGEKARLVLAKIALHRPAMLILDEPTNHLDLDMRDALAMALQGYEGAVVIVSHDRALLEKTVDDFWLLRAGELTSFQGDLDDYANLERITSGTSKKTSHSKKGDRQARAKKRAEEQALRKQITSLERKMERSGAQLADIETRLADKASYESLSKDELDKLLKETGQLRKQLGQTEEEWLTATQAMEDAKS
ncbi:MAG: ATP-binding cassette domain-containing protein [Pseudomonadales bacterium]|nr:ATP-binding cassette domain-containing protein [Pseudomonadales bacterium]